MDMQRAIETVTTRVRSGVGGYVCFSNVHTVVMAHSDPRLREITNDSFLSMPDGKPIAVLARLKGIGGVKRVAGPDFLPRFVCKASGLRHFFYGSSHQALENLVVRLRQDYPKINIAGWYSPPFREMTTLENDEAIKLINAARPDVVWVGLGAPKQEYWMAEHWRSLQPAVVLGVGAAFDFHAGLLARAPTWIQAVGLEWLHRFCQEPTRLWRRYLFTNSLFMFYLLRDALRH
jgi:N-acetylglucosaminyldiphosphoundecaprenol N-acetyl-beta-D-mannosaminyltransferase